jgi:hypothetical protein
MNKIGKLNLNRFYLLWLVTYILFFNLLLHGQTTTIRKDKETALTFKKKGGEIYLLVINLSKNQGKGIPITPTAPADLEPLYPINSTESFKFGKKSIRSFEGKNVTIFNDLSELDLKALSDPWLSRKVVKANSHWMYRFSDLKGKPVFLAGSTVFIGNKEDIKKGDYSVIGNNRFKNINQVVYYKASYTQKKLKSIYLSNGHFIDSIKGKKELSQFNVSCWNKNSLRTILALYKKKEFVGWKLILKNLGTEMLFDEGSLMMDSLKNLRYNSGKQYLFQPLSDWGFMLIDKKWGSQDIYNLNGYPLSKSHYMGMKRQKSLSLKIPKINDPKGDTITIGESTPNIAKQEMVDFSRFQRITLRVATYGDQEGIKIHYMYPCLRQVSVVKMSDKAQVSRVITRSNEFGEILPEVPLTDDTCLNTPIHQAVLSGNVTAVEEKLNEGHFVTDSNIDGNTPLHLAAIKGYTRTAELLINKGAVVYSKNELGTTPLHFAAASGNERMTELLISKGRPEENEFGIGVNITNRAGMTPLHYAAIHGQQKTVQLLLSKKAIPDSRDFNGYTPLQYINHHLVYSLNRENKGYLVAIADQLLQQTVWFKKRFTIPFQIENKLYNLNISAVKLNFFECGKTLTPSKQRVYRRCFAASETRYIAWELHLKYPEVSQKVNFTFQVVCKKEDEGEIHRYNQQVSFQKNWTTSWHTGSYGSLKATYWAPGVCTIEFYINKTRIAAGSFMVY